MPTKEESLTAGLAVLARAGINSPEAGKLLRDNADCADILVLMEKAKLFSEPRENKTLFANSINLVKRLNDTSRKEYHPETINSFMELYKLISGGSDSPCYLTPVIQNVLVSHFETNDHIRRVIRIIQLNGAISQAFINNLFSNVYSYTRLYKFVHDDIKPEEAADATYLYILQKPDSVTCVSKLNETLCLAQHLGEHPWLDKEIFKILIDHAENSLTLIMDFGLLAKSNLLVEYRDVVVKNHEFGRILKILDEHKMLDRDHIQLAISDPNFKKAYSLCQSILWLDSWRSKIDDPKGFVVQLLKNPDLTQALGVLIQIIEEKMQQNPETLITSFEKDLEAILASARVTVKPSKSNVCNSQTFFPATNPCSLAECLAKIKEKYQTVEAPVQNTPEP